jgi:hypothetical protein
MADVSGVTGIGNLGFDIMESNIRFNPIIGARLGLSSI